MRYARRTVVFGLLLGGLCQLWAPRPGLAQHPPVVRGRVVEEGTGRPVAGARIQVVDGTLETLSAADGTFLIRGLLPGTRTLRIHALGYAPLTATVQATNGRVATLRLELPVLPLDVPGVEATGAGAASLPSDAVVLDSARIRRSGARDVGELLESVAGVTVVRRGGPGAPAGVSIRGSSADQVLVLVNGIPANSMLTGEADVSTLPLEGVERVVVLRGGASSRYGGRALGGVVLVESGVSPVSGLAVRAGAESFGGRSAAVEVSGDLETERGSELSGTLWAAWDRTEGEFDYVRPPQRGGGEAPRENAHALRRSVRAMGEWTPGAYGPRLQARLEAVELDRGMPGPVTQPSTTGRQDQSRYGLAVSASDSWGGLDGRISLQLQRQEARFRDPDPPLGPAFDQGTRVDGAGLVTSVQGEGGHHRWEGGLEARGYRVRAGSLAPGARGHRTLGAWASLRATGEPAPGWHLAGGPGIRLDWSSRLRGAWASPRLGASLTRGHVTGRVAVSSSFSPPSLSDQFFQEGVLVRPNPDLRPERVRPEIEAGVDVELGLGPARVDLTAEAYRADVQGMIVWFPDHRFVWSPRNVDVTRRGGELRGRLALPRTDLTLQGGAAWSRVEYAGPVLDGQVVYRPALTGDLRLGWSPGAGEAEVTARYTGSRRTVAGSALNALDPFWIVDLRVGWSFEPGGTPVEARIRVENLLDRRASILPDYPRPGRAFGLELRVRPFDSSF